MFCDLFVIRRFVGFIPSLKRLGAVSLLAIFVIDLLP